MSLAVRTRFAPSPTGSLHVGNLRVAAFNYLFAKKHEGAFVLRIEDTDLERNIEGALAGLMEDLRWAGLEWDEGPDRGGPYGPYLQSERTGRHIERAQELLDRGLAYRCFCAEEVVESREKAGAGGGCSGGCRELTPAEASTREEAGGIPAALRFAVEGEVIDVRDEIRGDIQFSGNDIRDFVILRSEARATYNFAVVVDDIDMRISHVIRGAGHLSNTPKQAVLYDALQVARPVFVHLPTVLGPDGSRLSKRTGAPGIDRLREEGVHPEAVVNYLSLLGWSPGGDREVMSLEQIADSLELGQVGSSNTVYDPEKLRWMSGQHLARMSLDGLADAVGPYLDRERFPLDGERLENALDAIRTRLHTLSEINETLAVVFADADVIHSAHRELTAEGEGTHQLLRAAAGRLGELEPWTADTISRTIREIGKAEGLAGAALFHPLRLALCGSRSGPDLGKMLVALGRERGIELLQSAGSGPNA